MKDEELKYYYFLHTIPGIGNKTIKHLLERFPSPKEIYLASEKELLPFLTKKQHARLIEHKKIWNLDSQYQKLQTKRIQLIPMGDFRYPSRLKEIPDPPQIIYVKGRLPKETQYSVAVVGARICSDYGRYVARTFSIQLARAGIPVISGMAMGVDGISQRAALKAGGESYAVLGCGVDICYPKENQDIYDIMGSQYGIISEYPPMTEPKPCFFPPRNRIISGLSDTILVIEAKEKSGTSITVNMALEQGKEVYAVPGRITDFLSRGCNHLIEQGAGMALSPDDFLEEIGFCSKKENKTDAREEKLKPKEKIVLSVLEVNPMPLYQIQQKVECIEKIELPELMESLMSLCALGLARQRENYFIRIPE